MAAGAAREERELRRADGGVDLCSGEEEDGDGLDGAGVDGSWPERERVVVVRHGTRQRGTRQQGTTNRRRPSVAGRLVSFWARERGRQTGHNRRHAKVIGRLAGMRGELKAGGARFMHTSVASRLTRP